MIDGFKGQYSFLSNFCMDMKPVLLDGQPYPSVEHAYQAAKTQSRDHRKYIQLCATPGLAKRVGRKVPMDENWELGDPPMKRQVMLDLVRQKFQQRGLRVSLEATGDQELVEVNWWGDTYWGVCTGVGENHLGKILMQVRAESLQTETAIEGFAEEAKRKRCAKNGCRNKVTSVAGVVGKALLRNFPDELGPHLDGGVGCMGITGGECYSCGRTMSWPTPRQDLLGDAYGPAMCLECGEPQPKLYSADEWIAALHEQLQELREQVLDLQTRMDMREGTGDG